MKKSISLIVIVAVLFCFTVGCSSDNNQNQSSFTVVDSIGREVSIAENPKKIISVSPAITEILFAIGLNEEIIGVSDYCDYPVEAQSKEKVGGFEDPNVEVIVSKNPDIVFASAGVQEELINKLEELGITVAVLDADNVQQVMGNIEIAGKITGKVEEANKIVEDMEERLEAVVTKVDGQPKPTVFFEVWDDPLMSAGSSSFHNNVIEICGGINIAGDNNERYYTYSMEKLLEADPDYYIVNDHNHEPKDVKTRKGYDILRAVKNNKVFSIDDNLINRAGPRVIQGIEQMTKMIHPEVFDDAK